MSMIMGTTEGFAIGDRVTFDLEGSRLGGTIVRIYDEEGGDYTGVEYWPEEYLIQAEDGERYSAQATADKIVRIQEENK